MVQDIIFSLRELRKHPGLAVTAILSLTLGIGATTAVFSVIYAFLVKPYPYLGADRMVYLNILNERGDNRGVGVTGAQYKALRQARCIESLAASWGTWNLTTTDEDLPEDVPSVQLSGNAGVHFGVPALLGRTLIPSDAPDGQDPQPVVLLSYPFWRRHYNSHPGVVGRNLQLVHKNYTVVGVMPERFTIGDADVYTPLKIGSDPAIVLQARVRLRPGVTRAAADAELQPLFEQFARETPTHFPKKFRVHVRWMIDGYLDHLGPALALLFAAVGVLLIVACANVSILLLARGTARQHELAVRSAIGAGRWRIARQLLTEALALSLAGAAGCILLANRLLPVLVASHSRGRQPGQFLTHALVISQVEERRREPGGGAEGAAVSRPAAIQMCDALSRNVPKLIETLVADCARPAEFCEGDGEFSRPVPVCAGNFPGDLRL